MCPSRSWQQSHRTSRKTQDSFGGSMRRRCVIAKNASRFGERLAEHHEEYHWIERRAGTRTRTMGIGHRNDLNTASQSRGGPTDDRIKAIVCSGKSRCASKQTLTKTTQLFKAESKFSTIRRGIPQRNATSAPNNSPRNENILALPRNESLSKRQPWNGCRQTTLLRTTVGPVASGNWSPADDNTQNTVAILTNVDQPSTKATGFGERSATIGSGVAFPRALLRQKS